MVADLMILNTLHIHNKVHLNYSHMKCLLPVSPKTTNLNIFLFKLLKQPHPSLVICLHDDTLIYDYSHREGPRGRQ